MTDIATTLRECHEIVWRYRAELEPYWPTPPDVRDSLRFAVCEACEALDAALRSKPEYARNNVKNLSVEDELCDCLLMLMTAIGKDATVHVSEMPDSWDWPSDGLDAIVCLSAELLEICLSGLDSIWPKRLWFATSEIALFVGPTVAQRLTARLERIKAKRLPKPKVTINDAYAVAMARHESEAA